MINNLIIFLFYSKNIMATSNLANAIRNLTPGYSVDVSTFGADGKGYRTSPTPKSLDRSKKKYVAGFPQLISDNVPGYANAVAVLGPEYNRFLAEFRKLDVSQAVKARSPRSKSPSKSKPKSKSRSASPSKKGKSKSKKSKTPKSPRSPRFTTDAEIRTFLVGRIQEAERLGKLLDVSHVKRDGSGTHLIKPLSEKSRKIGIAPLRVVSKYYDNYDLVMNWLGPEYRQYTAHYAEFARSLGLARSPSNKTSPLPQTLPPATVLIPGTGPRTPPGTPPGTPRMTVAPISPTRQVRFL
jgi:hypothetical protein